MGVFDKETLELLGGDPRGDIGNPSAPDGFRVPSGAETAIVGDAYEGASRTSQQLMDYNVAMRSADADLAPAKRLGDLRSRDMGRNDPKVQSGMSIRKDGIVGAYFMLNAKPNSKRLFGAEDEVWEEDFQEEVEEKFAAYAESNDAWIDASRHDTLTGLTRMAVDQHTLSGEVLATVEWMRDSTRPMRTAIQMIDTDRLSSPPEKIGDRYTRMGVQMDRYGAPEGYHIRMAHPSDYLKSPENMQWKYVPVRKPWNRLQVLHIYERFRPGQSRGLGTMVAALPELKMSRKFREIVLQNAILNATYAATIESELPAEAVFARLGGDSFSPEAIAEALQGYIGSHYETMAKLMGGSNHLKIDGVRIPHLPPGTKLALNGAGDGGPLGTDFEVSLDRIYASALGASYEQVSKDYTKTNYSGFKGALSEAWKTMHSVKRAVADRFASSVYRLWLEEALNNGEITSIKRRMPSWYEGLNAEFYSSCEFIGSTRGQIDELKETQAAVLRINNGLSTLEEENARLGRDWRRILRQTKREQQWKDRYGILQLATDTTNQENSANPGSGTKDNTQAIADAVAAAVVAAMEDMK